MQIKTGISFSKEQLFELYENDTLIGLVRVLGDGIHTVLIQDILVSTKMQNQGYGSILLRHVLEKCKLYGKYFLYVIWMKNLKDFISNKD